MPQAYDSCMAKRPIKSSPPEPVETVIDGKTYRGSYYVRGDSVHVTGPGGATSRPIRIGLGSAQSMARVELGIMVMKSKLHGSSDIDDDDDDA